MTIRSGAKAAIVRDGCLLMQRCRTAEGFAYYELPGGGQNAGETLEEAVVRECLEETGYWVRVVRFLGLQEEIFTNEAVQRAFPEHAHRILHVFLCELTNAPMNAHTEEDPHQEEILWVPIDSLQGKVVRPEFVKAVLPRLLLAEDEIGYLPANQIDIFFS